MTNPSWHDYPGAGCPQSSDEETATAPESTTLCLTIPLVAERVDMQDPRQHRSFLERHLLSQVADLRPVQFGASNRFCSQEGLDHGQRDGRSEGPLERAVSDDNVATPREGGALLTIHSSVTERCESWLRSRPEIPFLTPTFSPESAQTLPAWRSSVPPEDSSPEGLGLYYEADGHAEPSDANGGSLEVSPPEPVSREQAQEQVFSSDGNLVPLIMRLLTDWQNGKLGPVEVVSGENKPASSRSDVVAADACFYTGCRETSAPSGDRSSNGWGADLAASGWKLHTIEDSVEEPNDESGRTDPVPERVIPLDPVTSERVHDPRFLLRGWRARCIGSHVIDVGAVSGRCEPHPSRRESVGGGVERYSAPESSAAVIGGMKGELMGDSVAETLPTAQMVSRPVHVPLSPASPVRGASRTPSDLSTEPSTRMDAGTLGRAGVYSSRPSPERERTLIPTGAAVSPGLLPTAPYVPQQPPNAELQQVPCQPVVEYTTAAYWFPLVWPQVASYALLPTQAVPLGQSETYEQLPKPVALPSLSVLAQPQVCSLPSLAQLAPAQNVSLEDEGQSLANFLPPQQTRQPHVDPPLRAATVSCQQSPWSSPTQLQPEYEPRRPPSYPWQPGFLCEGEKQQETAFASQPLQSGGFALPPTQLQPVSALSVSAPNTWEPGYLCSVEQQQVQPPASLQGNGYFSLPPTQLQEVGPSQPSSWSWGTGAEYQAEQPEARPLPYRYVPRTEEKYFELHSTQLYGETAPPVCTFRPCEPVVDWPHDQEQGDPSAPRPQPPPGADPLAFPQRQQQLSSVPSVLQWHRENCRYARPAVEPPARTPAAVSERPQAQQFAQLHSEGQAPRFPCPLHSGNRQRKSTLSSQPQQERSFHQGQMEPKNSSQCPPRMSPGRRLYLRAPQAQRRDVPLLAPPPPPPSLPPSAQPEPRSFPPLWPPRPPVSAHAAMQPPTPTVPSTPPTPQLPFSGFRFPPQRSATEPTPAQCPRHSSLQQVKCPAVHGASRSPQKGQRASQSRFLGFFGPPPPRRAPVAPPLPRYPPPSQPPPPASPPPKWTGVIPPLPASPPPSRPPLPPSSPPWRAEVRRPQRRSPPPSLPLLQLSSPPPGWMGGRPPLPMSPPPRIPPLPLDSPPPDSPPSSSRRPAHHRRDGSVGSPPLGTSHRSRRAAWRPSRIRELLGHRRHGQQRAKSSSRGLSHR